MKITTAWMKRKIILTQEEILTLIDGECVLDDSEYATIIEMEKK